MSDATMFIQRLETLEARIMHQDRVIEDLNTTITAQWKRIDGTARHIAMLDDRLRDMAGAGPMAPDVPPPHY